MLTLTDLLYLAVTIIITGAVIAVFMAVMGGIFHGATQALHRVPTRWMTWVHVVALGIWGSVYAYRWTGPFWLVVRVVSVAVVLSAVRVLTDRATIRDLAKRPEGS